MKKLTSFMVAAVFLGANITAMAGTPKPPKELCLQLSPYTDVLVLGTKSQSKIALASGKQTFYNVVGEWDAFGSYSVPMSGSGHMNGDTFHASITGAAFANGLYGLWGAEIFWDVVSSTGSASLILDLNPGGNTDTVTPVQVPCSSVDLTYGPESGAAFGDF